jgi:hypothetical protein
MTPNGRIVVATNPVSHCDAETDSKLDPLPGSEYLAALHFPRGVPLSSVEAFTAPFGSGWPLSTVDLADRLLDERGVLIE